MHETLMADSTGAVWHGAYSRRSCQVDISWLLTLNVGIGLGAFFFIIYASYALAFSFGATLILQGNTDAGTVITVFTAIFVGSASLAILAPDLQGARDAPKRLDKIIHFFNFNEIFYISYIFGLQQYLMPVVQLPSSTRPWNAFRQSTVHHPMVSSLKTCWAGSILTMSNSAIPADRTYLLSRTLVSHLKQERPPP